MNPIKPAEISDPYPERVTCLGGVRHTISTRQLTVRARRHAPEAVPARTCLAASFPTPQQQRSNWRLPIASTILNAFGHAALGASIAIGTVDPAIGATAAVGWMTCGLALIAAQCITINTSQGAGR